MGQIQNQIQFPRAVDTGACRLRWQVRLLEQEIEFETIKTPRVPLKPRDPTCHLILQRVPDGRLREGSLTRRPRRTPCQVPAPTAPAQRRRCTCCLVAPATSLTIRSVDELVDRLINEEGRYQEVTLRLMLGVASMESFPNLEEQQDSEVLLEKARRAVAGLRHYTEQQQALRSDREQRDAERQAYAVQVEAQRRFSDELNALHQTFNTMHSMTDAQQRGYQFQDLLYELFPASLADAHVLGAKVRERGRNTLGLFISVRGLSSNARDAYSRGTPFITMDGQDLQLVLEGRVRLDELLRRKKRHADDTGSCYFPAGETFQ